MNADTVLHQRIGRLTPLTDVLAAIGRIEPVAAREIAPADAAGCVLSADVPAWDSRPVAPVALRDGWAVASEATRDAGPYAPLTIEPPPPRVDAFAPLPSGIDAVAPLEAMTLLGGMMQVMEPVAPGQSVLAAGGDIESDTTLCPAGLRLRASDVAVLLAANIARVCIRRPHIRIAVARPDDMILDATASMLVRAITAAGADTEIAYDLDHALRAGDANAVIGIGGTGSGRGDRSVIGLSQAGTVNCHGIGLSPGETAAFGMIGHRPVLLMPGRIDAVLACWLVLGCKIVDRLAGARAADIAVKATLARKVTSAVGIAEVILLRRIGGEVEPLASGYLSLQSLARADGWMLVPAESEGYQADTAIEMRPLP